MSNTFLHRLAVLVAGVYSHIYMYLQYCPLESVLGNTFCRKSSPDLSSSLLVGALSSALSTRDHWPDDLIKRPHPALVLLYELCFAVICSEIVIVAIWEPLLGILGALGEQIKTLGLDQLGEHIKTAQGQEQIKLFLASLMVYLELIYIEPHWLNTDTFRENTLVVNGIGIDDAGDRRSYRRVFDDFEEDDEEDDDDDEDDD